MIADVLAAVRGKLLADSALAGVISGIYADKAPEKAVTPYIILSIAGGMTKAQTMGFDTDVVEVNVKVVVNADKDTAATATNIAAEVRRVLHRSKLSIPGWWFYEMKHRTPFYFTELVERRAYVYAGGLFRLEADQPIS
jgi:hypothetical protein